MMIKTIKNFFDAIDLGKRFKDHIDKRIFRAAFIIIAIIQIVALSMTGWDFSPVWVECDLNTTSIDYLENTCENPFYMSGISACDKNKDLCYIERLQNGQTLGNKPPAFAFAANPLSWLVLFIAFNVNYIVCKRRRIKKNG